MRRSKISASIIISVFCTIFLLSPPTIATAGESRMDKIERAIRELQQENTQLRNELDNVKKEKEIDEGKIYKQKKVLQDLNEKSQTLKDTLDLVGSETEETRLNLLNGLVNISGYADAEFRATNKNNDTSRFRIRHLSLFLNKEIEKQWNFFSEIEFEDTPLVRSNHTTDEADKVQGKILIEQVYIEFKPVLGLDFRFGRFLTPAGIWSIYHYYPYVPTQTRPLMVRKIFPQVSDGVLARKVFPLYGSLIDTHLYISNGSGNPGRLDRNNNKAIGARINLSRSVLNNINIDLGLSYYGERDNHDTRKDSVALHFKGTYRTLTLQTEYATRRNDPTTGSAYNDTGLYAQLSYDIKNWTVAGRADWYDVNDSIKNADQYQYTTALNYHFSHNVVAKFELNWNEFADESNEDFVEAITSIVIAIGEQ